MSLIQEALRRQSEENSRKGDSVTPEPEVPAAPPPAPAPPEAAAAAEPVQAEPQSAAKPARKMSIAKKTPEPVVPEPEPEPQPELVQEVSEEPETVTAAEEPAAQEPEDKSPAPAEAESQPPPLPESAAGKETKPWMILVGILVAVMIFLGGAIFMVMTAMQKFKTGAESAMADLTEQVIDSAEEAAASPEPQPVPVAPAVPPSPPAKPAVPAETAVSEAPPSVPVAPAARPQPVQPEPEPEIFREPVIWPSLSVAGVVGRGRNGSVIIDGEVIAVGESYNGVTILSIQSQGAWMEYEGEKKFIRVGK